MSWQLVQFVTVALTLASTADGVCADRRAANPARHRRLA